MTLLFSCDDYLLLFRKCLLSFILILSLYCLICRSKDVLELIAKMLSFSDEQKEAVGLGPTSLIASLLVTVVGKPTPPADLEVSD